MLQLGVDEAGYGPLLGPIVIGAVALRLEAAEPGPEPLDLRARLAGLVCRAGEAPRTRPPPALPVPVDDSKQVRARHGLGGLARGVGAFAAAADQPPPANLEDLLRRFSDRAAGDYAGVPWFGDLAAAGVPRYPWTGPLEGAFRARGVSALDLRVLPVDVAEWNGDLRRWGSKARVLGLYCATLLLSILDRHPGEDAEVLVDRHGGRKDYRAYLEGIFPFARVCDRPAAPGAWSYDVRLPDRQLVFHFLTGGDRRALAVGWASMAAKLARELFMARLNAWFTARRPDLRPTAGYVQDGRRFLLEVDPLLAAAGIAPERIRRSR